QVNQGTRAHVRSAGATCRFGGELSLGYLVARSAHIADELDHASIIVARRVAHALLRAASSLHSTPHRPGERASARVPTRQARVPAPRLPVSKCGARSGPAVPLRPQSAYRFSANREAAA